MWRHNKNKYTDLTDLLLHDPDFVCDAVYCSGRENCSEQHKQDLILLYEKLTRAMKTAGEMTFPESAKSNFTPVPGWKELLETPYNEARNAYLVWRSTNRPRSGPVHEWMKRTRARFKYAQKVAKRNEDTFRSHAMAAKFDTGDIKGFWKCVKDYNTGPIAHSNKVDNATQKQSAWLWWINVWTFSVCFTQIKCYFSYCLAVISQTWFLAWWIYDNNDRSYFEKQKWRYDFQE